MRKILLSIMAALLLLLPVTQGLAETISCPIPDLDLLITFPIDFFFVTRDLLAGKPEARELLDQFEASGLYLYVSPDNQSEEINLTMTHVGDFDISTMSMPKENLLVDLISDGLFGQGLKVDRYGMDWGSGRAFFKLEFSSYDDTVHGIMYCTTYNGDAFFLTLRSYTGSISSRQEKTVQDMAYSMQFQ